MADWTTGVPASTVLVGDILDADRSGEDIARVRSVTKDKEGYLVIDRRSKPVRILPTTLVDVYR